MVELGMTLSVVISLAGSEWGTKNLPSVLFWLNFKEHPTVGKVVIAVNVFVLMMTFLTSNSWRVKFDKEKIINVLYWETLGEFETWSNN